MKERKKLLSSLSSLGLLEDEGRQSAKEQPPFYTSLAMSLARLQSDGARIRLEGRYAPIQ